MNLGKQSLERGRSCRLAREPERSPFPEPDPVPVPVPLTFRRTGKKLRTVLIQSGGSKALIRLVSLSKLLVRIRNDFEYLFRGIHYLNLVEILLSH